MRGSLSSGSPADTRAAAVALAGLLEPGDVVTLCGDLGAGKTAFVQGVAEGLGVSGPVVSPTFNILVVHPGRLALNHFDLYRLDRIDELEDVDFFGTLEAGGVSFVEWGDRFPRALPADRLEISIAIVGGDERRLDVRGSGDRGSPLAAAWLGLLPGVEVSS